MVNYNSEGAVSVTTFSTDDGAHQPRTESKLAITKAGKKDQGNYTCSPSNAEQATVVIFVTRGKDRHHLKTRKLGGNFQIGLKDFKHKKILLLIIINNPNNSSILWFSLI